ncbi:MAG: hypothetical protein COC19_00505 [SAR86 cluster bacterium]|uniref:DUF4760 domain-containing protein n=1 Tax=SAR86 cluster bacterium TaxID=2030880 RepID=A0A2A4MVM0_9GAMM|nr:MAG: hypothetical protein COC19_00505 [SAR86 cluster bacterium]
MKNIEKWINYATGVGVLLGIVFLGLEIRQNTDMMRSQARDSITEKQMMLSEWVVTEPEMAVVIVAAADGFENMSPEHRVMYGYFLAGVWREWENSYYQFQSGLFELQEFEPRMLRWRSQLDTLAARQQWKATRQWYAPDFREVVDGFVAEIETQ